MAQVVTAPSPIDVEGMRVFLGGAIDMGRATNWQANSALLFRDCDDLVLLNPRRETFSVDRLDEQVRWELDSLAASDLILMWFPEKAAAPIALLETGLYFESGKLRLGVHPDYPRRRNLELTAERLGVVVRNSLDDLAVDVIREYTKWRNAHSSRG